MSKWYKIFSLGLGVTACSAMTVFASARELPTMVGDTAAILLQQAKKIAIEHTKGGQVPNQEEETDVVYTAAITFEQAKAVAFENAGIDGTGVVFDKEKLDKGVYELKFYNANGKYEYEISSVDGAILKCEWEVQVSRSDTAAVITLKQARAIAFEHAGIDGTGVVFDKEKLDKGVYELKFYDANGKYEYEISSVNGTILKCELEVQMSRPDILVSDVPETVDVAGSISKEQACQIALEDVGFVRENLKYITCYVVWDRHTPYAYEVKFSENRAPYDNYLYRIDLYTGDILSGGCVLKHVKHKK